MQRNNYLLPPEDAVAPDGSILLWGVEETEALWGTEYLTDLKDIDFTPLKNPKVWTIYLLCYKPNAGKKFSFMPVKDPSYKAKS